jgi:hypothetical protein
MQFGDFCWQVASWWVLGGLGTCPCCREGGAGWRLIGCWHQPADQDLPTVPHTGHTTRDRLGGERLLRRGRVTLPSRRRLSHRLGSLPDIRINLKDRPGWWPAHTLLGPLSIVRMGAGTETGTGTEPTGPQRLFESHTPTVPLSTVTHGIQPGPTLRHAQLSRVSGAHPSTRGRFAAQELVHSPSGALGCELPCEESAARPKIPSPLRAPELSAKGMGGGKEEG